MDSEKHKNGMKIIYLRVFVVFFLSFCIINSFAHSQTRERKEEEKLKATYTAETTVQRMESQLNIYFTKSDALKRLIAKGYTVDDSDFEILADSLWENDGVIEAIELAPDGVVTQVYPKEGNEEAFGLDLIEDELRGSYAKLARDSGEYAIAGPFELVQGGLGALLLDPVYLQQEDGENVFWGFALLVINWDNFIDGLELNKLEETSYAYQIWKRHIVSGNRIVLAQGVDAASEEGLEVICAVPNDTWYFDIAPLDGWVSQTQLLLDSVLCAALAFLLALVYWMFETRHIKDERYAEEIKHAAEKAEAASAAKTRFLFNMSHDIRTPMNAIIGFSELLEEHIDEKEKALDYLAKIRSSSDFLLSLINHVLEMARIESGKETLSSEVCDIRQMSDSLKDVFEPTCREKSLTFEQTLDIKHEHVLCDGTKVREILINVIGNSVKYTPAGGKVTAEIKEIPCDKASYAAYRMVIQDNGIGMSKEYLPHIFEEFTRERTSTETHVVGTGLGLPIVKTLLDLMGGTIQVESAVGQGTTMTITVAFPIAGEKAIEKHETRLDRRVLAEKIRGKRILLAEDNELNAEIALTVLSENGIKAEHAEDGEACVRMLEEKPIGYYDAILMDIQMPKLDGYQATARIRGLQNERANIPIIAMTANAFDEDKKKAFASGMNGYITKPISIENVLETLGKVLK